MTIDYQAVQLQNVAAILLGAMPWSAGFTGKAEHPGPSQNLVELAQVIKYDQRFGPVPKVCLATQIT